MRKHLAKTAGSLKNSASRLALRLLKTFRRAENDPEDSRPDLDHDHNQAPSRDRRHRKLPFGKRRRRAADRRWGLADTVPDSLDNVKKRDSVKKNATPPAPAPHQGPF